MTKPAETDLYPPVKSFLESLGFTVKGEIQGCDVMALRGDDQPLLVLAELKLGLSIELLMQAADRMTLADEVWIAVPATRRGRDQDRRAHRLCRMLGIGLLAVTLSTGRVAVLADPGPYRARLASRKRSRLMREFERRQGDTAQGGSSRRKILTAYRQRALACAALLKGGPQPLAILRARAPDAASILQRNVYGWFERVARGVYQLTPAGRTDVPAWQGERGETP